MGVGCRTNMTVEHNQGPQRREDTADTVAP